MRNDGRLLRRRLNLVTIFSVCFVVFLLCPNPDSSEARIPDGYRSIVLLYRVGMDDSGKAYTSAASGTIVGTSTESAHHIIATSQHFTEGDDLVLVFFPSFDRKENDKRISKWSYNEEIIEERLLSAACSYGLVKRSLCRDMGYSWIKTSYKMLRRCHGKEIYATESKTLPNGMTVIDKVHSIGSIKLGRVIYEDSRLDLALLSSCVDFDSEQITTFTHCKELEPGQTVHIFGSVLDGIDVEDDFGLWRWIPGRFIDCTEDTVYVDSVGAGGRSGGPVLAEDGSLVGIHKRSNRETESLEVPAYHLNDVFAKRRSAHIISIHNSSGSAVPLRVKCSRSNKWKKYTVGNKITQGIVCFGEAAGPIKIRLFSKERTVRSFGRQVIVDEKGNITSPINLEIDARNYELRFENGTDKVDLFCDDGGRPPGCGGRR